MTYQVQKFPVSIKGVVLRESKVILLKNERDEWELPGGKLELGESPEDCLVREVQEELGIDVKVGSLLDVWVYHIYEGLDVLIATYQCHLKALIDPRVSNEHSDLQSFA